MAHDLGNSEELPPDGPAGPPEAPTHPPLPVASASEFVDSHLLLPAVDEFEPVAEGISEVLPLVPSWLTSLVIHLSLVLMMATWTSVQSRPDLPHSLQITTEGDVPRVPATDEVLATTTIDALPPVEDAKALSPTVLDEAELPSPDPGPLLADVDTIASFEGGFGGLPADIAGNGLSLRTNAELRNSLVISGGGTPESEAAVEAALRWLAAHQLPDGRWSFQHQAHPDCLGKCSQPGSHQADIAATSLALLPFLGTGQTHREGTYRETVRRGLEYLVNSIKQDGNLGSLWQPQGTMYGHGLAAIVLCEAFGMTGDRWLFRPAQSVTNFIVDAQDPRGGGWRYNPHMPGDTSVVGWQLMALKSAHMAELRVSPDVFRKAGHFLDSVEVNYGAGYGYDQPQSGRHSTTAIGLLCRMYLGWTKRTKALREGVIQLSELGPSTDKTPLRNNLYYDYYATQVMRHWGGAQWRRWNEIMRDYLVLTQNHQGHENGSWYFDGDHGSTPGGRLYCTAMSAMILEVYYRHLPLYGERSLRQ